MIWTVSTAGKVLNSLVIVDFSNNITNNKFFSWKYDYD